MSPHCRPGSLYNQAIRAVAKEYALEYRCRRELLILPNHVLLDIYKYYYHNSHLCLLSKEFSCIHAIDKVLQTKGERKSFLLLCYQEVLIHDIKVTETLYKTFSESAFLDNEPADIDLIRLGLGISGFLKELGLFASSLKFLEVTEHLLKKKKAKLSVPMLECYYLRLYSESQYCEFTSAAKTCKKLLKLLETIEMTCPISSLISTFLVLSNYCYILSYFDESYNWALKAFELLPLGLTNRTSIEILRQTSKACIGKRKYLQAGFLIRQAINLCELLETSYACPLVSDVLMDYGHFLLNSDYVKESVAAYEKALARRRSYFRIDNILLALTHEDLAYSLYVSEYNSGDFALAKTHADNSIQIMKKLLPINHLLVASVQRVKALILEEIALNMNYSEIKTDHSLNIVEEIHSTALKLSQSSFGEKNLQTAKHYGNLGRLYQSMKRYDEAEKMHLKSIQIKEDVLGPDDYEVGLSVGHLASLYNYHMKKYTEAEQLYFRSIEINMKLFGPAYSGLEYDYRGLINVYCKLSEPSKCLFYSLKYQDWKTLRDNIKPVDDKEPLLTTQEIVAKFSVFEQEQQELYEERMLLVEEFRQQREDLKAKCI